MRRIVVAALGLGVLVAACGDNDNDIAADNAAGEEPDADLVVVAGETEETQLGYALEGDDVTSPGPTLRLPAGEEVTIAVDNRGRFTHDLVVVAERRADAEPLWGAATAFLPAGESESVTFTPETPGRFFYICTLEGHLSVGGMWGRLVVED